jgi:sugar phosphate permease
VSILSPHLDKIFNHAQVGLLMNASLFLYGISAFFFGLIADKTDSKKFIIMGLIICSGIYTLLAFIPKLSENFLIFFVILLIFGIFQGTGLAPSMKALGLWYTNKERNFFGMLWASCKNICGGGASYIVWFGIFLFGGNWRLGGFFFPSLLCIIICVFLFFKMNDSPVRAGFKPVNKITTDDTESFLDSIKRVSKSKILNYSIANALMFATRWGVLNWCIIFLTSNKGISPSLAFIAYSLFEAGGMVGVIASGVIIKTVFADDEKVTVFTLLVSSALIIFVYILVDYSKVPLVSIFVIFFIGFCAYIPMNLVQIRIIAIVPKKHVASATTFSEMFGYLFGFTFGTSILGIISHYFSLNVALLILPILSIFASIILVKVWHKKVEF